MTRYSTYSLSVMCSCVGNQWKCRCRRVRQPLSRRMTLSPSLFSSPQEHKVLLTGTPLQNTVEELFSLLHFLEPAQFPSETEFLREFGDLKTEEQVF